MTVAVDTMVLIWGLKSAGARAGNPRQPNLKEMQLRSVILLDMLEEQKETIIVPTVAVAELLVGVEPAKHGDFIAEFQQRFFCPPFDLRASALAAELWLYHRGLPKGEQLQRNVLKSDVMIIATAKAAGATVYYSQERKARALATKVGMRAEELPERHPDMFRDQEIRERVGM